MQRFITWMLIIGGIYACSHPSNARPSANWQNQDLQSDGVFGISTEKAYAKLLGGKTAKKVIIAVIDSGIDTAQDDLRTMLWTDPADGSHGRNYIVKETGKEDFIPMLAKNPTTPGYGRTLADYNLHVQRLETFMTQLSESKKILAQIVQNIGKEQPTLEDFKLYQPRNGIEQAVVNLILERLPWYPDFSSLQFHEVDHLLELGNDHLEHGLNRKVTAQDSARSSFADEVNTDISNDALGMLTDPNVMPEHGTYLSGIIAASRNNGKGINGIADHAQVMMLKLYNHIREARDEHVAAAIRFAVDHGARVISMSFGKTFSLHKEAVDSAVKYAMSRDVLIVHSSGNNGMNLDADSNSFFPSPQYRGGGVAPAWITVGASGFRDDSTLMAPFSNYGQRTVDVFAPGVQITSTIPHGQLATWDGTSQATAVVAGLATLIRSYYPGLTAVQVKDVIMKSVVKREVLRNKCISGGVANAYQALRLAAEYK